MSCNAALIFNNLNILSLTYLSLNIVFHSFNIYNLYKITVGLFDVFMSCNISEYFKLCRYTCLYSTKYSGYTEENYKL